MISRDEANTKKYQGLENPIAEDFTVRFYVSEVGYRVSVGQKLRCIGTSKKTRSETLSDCAITIIYIEMLLNFKPIFKLKVMSLPQLPH
jgi:hypothetical protein